MEFCAGAQEEQILESPSHRSSSGLVLESRLVFLSGARESDRPWTLRAGPPPLSEDISVA